MKRLLTAVLAAAMVLSLSVFAFAASPTYRVAYLSSLGYLADKDGVVDLDNPVSSRTEVDFGETVYFPLFNANRDTYEQNSDSADAAKKALEKANADYAAAQSAEADAQKARDAAKKAVDDFDTKAAEIKTAFETAESALTQYTNAKSALAALGNKSVWTDRLAKVDTTVLTDALIASTIGARYPATATDLTVLALPANLFSTSLDAVGYGLPAGNYTKKQAIEIATTNRNNAITQFKGEIKKIEDAEKNAATKKTALSNALKAVNRLFPSFTVTDPDKVTAQALSTAKANSQNKTALTKALSDAESALTKAKAATEKAKSAQEAAQKAYDAASSSADGSYIFVHESSAVSSAKVSLSWKEGKKFVESADIVRRTASSKTFYLGSNSAMRKIYFLAVKTKSASTTETEYASGTARIRKSGSDGFDVESSISITLKYAAADSDGMIPKTPAVFDEGDGFYADEEFTFYFADDDYSSFVVDTRRQGEILLGFDTDFDDKIGDKVAKTNPNADLDFYNGNYAKFKKTGTLYLSYPESKAYVYEISSSGKLSLVSNAKYDKDEEAFVIRTNTLGRYVISTEKLKLTESSSSESSAPSSSTSSVSNAPRPSSSTAAPPASTAPPRSSTTPPSSSQSSSSKPSSSESSEISSSSAPSSSSEPSSEEVEEVIIRTEPDDPDVPTKKGGISWLIWALILAGLAAVLVAVGVIFYSNRNSGQRML